MKKTVIALMLVLAIVFSFSACKKAPEEPVTEKSTETVQVTDKNGEPVTDKSGEIVTEAAKPISEESTEKGEEKKKEKTAEKGKEKVTVPQAPENIEGLKAGNITENSVSLKWKGVDCDAYQIAYSADNQVTWNYLEKSYSKTQYSIKGLESYTTYYFRVRAFRKNEAGTRTCAWASVSAKTKAVDKERKMKITVILPAYSNNDDKLSIYVNDKLDSEYSVKLDGTAVEVETKKKYKGLVKVTAMVEQVESSATVETDKEELTVDISSYGIQVLDGGED